MGVPPTPGNPLSFVQTTDPTLYPNSTFPFPVAVALALSGLTFDGVAFVYDAQFNVIDVSNVARVTLQ